MIMMAFPSNRNLYAKKHRGLDKIIHLPIPRRNEG
jgi:hypothetical protein